MLKQPGHKAFLDCALHIKKYMKQNLRSWLDYANGHLGIGMEEKDIIFVSGHVKTTAWALAAFKHRSSDVDVFVTGGFGSSAAGGFSVSLARCVEPSVFCRSGPIDRAAVEPATVQGRLSDVKKYDQCIFLNYHKMRSHMGWSAIRAAAGLHQLAPSPDPDDELGAFPSSSATPPTQDHSQRPSISQSRSSGSISIGGSSELGSTPVRYPLACRPHSHSYATCMDVSHHGVEF